MKTRVGSLGRLVGGLSKGGRRYARPTMRTIRVPVGQSASYSGPGNSGLCDRNPGVPPCD